MQTKVGLTIDAPPRVVFETVSDISNFSRAVPHIQRVEFLTDRKKGAGTRFRETRLMRGREATSELEITEFVENERVRFESDAGGAIWDSLFTVAPAATGAGTRLELHMEARPYTLVSRLLGPLMKRLVGKAVAQDMEAVREYCEEAASPGGR